MAADPFGNLELVEESEMAAAFIDPAADFGAFKRVMLLDTYVSFRSGWERDQRRGTRGSGISARDVDRIKTRVSELFNSVMIETLEANDGYEVVSEEDYARQVENTALFLRGKSQELMVQLADDMEKAAAELAYEKAAVFRDQIAQLQHVQASQGIEGVSGDLDILAATAKGGTNNIAVCLPR